MDTRRSIILAALLVTIQDAVAMTNHNHGCGRGCSPKTAIGHMKTLLRNLDIRDVTDDELRYLDLNPGTDPQPNGGL